MGAQWLLLNLPATLVCVLTTPMTSTSNPNSVEDDNVIHVDLNILGISNILVMKKKDLGRILIQK